MRRSAVLLAMPLVVGLAGCGSAEPPAAGAKICQATDASWWYDATGADRLTGTVDGPNLPLKSSATGGAMFQRSDCRVLSGEKDVAWYRTRTELNNKVDNLAASITQSPPDERFSVAGGAGMVVPESSDGDGTTAWWTCGSAVLELHVLRPKDEKMRVELTKKLAQQVAGVVGCPPRIP